MKHKARKKRKPQQQRPISQDGKASSKKKTLPAKTKETTNGKTRRCAHCEKTKTLEGNFYKWKAGKLGYGYTCKTCIAEYITLKRKRKQHTAEKIKQQNSATAKAKAKPKHKPKD